MKRFNLKKTSKVLSVATLLGFSFLATAKAEVPNYHYGNLSSGVVIDNSESPIACDASANVPCGTGVCTGSGVASGSTGCSSGTGTGSGSGSGSNG